MFNLNLYVNKENINKLLLKKTYTKRHFYNSLGCQRLQNCQEQFGSGHGQWQFAVFVWRVVFLQISTCVYDSIYEWSDKDSWNPADISTKAGTMLNIYILAWYILYESNFQRNHHHRRHQIFHLVLTNLSAKTKFFIPNVIKV